MKDATCTDKTPPRRKRGRPPVIVGAQRHLSFQAPAEQADHLDALLPCPRRRSAVLREALGIALQRLTAAPAQDPTP